MSTFEVTEELSRKVLAVVDAGLVRGIGTPEPGKMCVEAAVCYAMGLDHGDEPTCVSRALRRFKIRLNDSRWSSDKARANGLRRLAVAQLGSAGVLDDVAFVAQLAVKAKEWANAAYAANANAYAADAAYAAAAAAAYAAAKAADAAAKAADAVAYAAAYAADAAADANANAASDKVLAAAAEDVVQILIGMNAPGCKYLYLTEAA